MWKLLEAFDNLSVGQSIEIGEFTLSCENGRSNNLYSLDRGSMTIIFGSKEEILEQIGFYIDISKEFVKTFASGGASEYDV